jgi:hypothetical protein
MARARRPNGRGSKARRAAFVPDPLVATIRLAGEHLDELPGGRLGWVLQFLRTDPARWLPGDAEAFASRLLAIVYGPLPPNMLQLGEGPIPPLEPDSVEQMHAELGAFFRQVVSGARLISIPTEGLSEAMCRVDEPEPRRQDGDNRPPRSLFVTSLGGPRRTILYQKIKELILKTDRLVACPQCGRPFLALRKMVYCQQSCLQAWHDAKRPKKGAGR